MQEQTKKRIVILGAGVAGAAAIRSIHKQFHGREDLNLLVIDKQNYSAYAPMLHEVATGSVRPDDITHPIREMINCCLEQFLQDEVTEIDIERRVVKTKSGEVNYDYLVVALGAASNFYGLPGVAEHSFPLKTMDDALTLKRRLIDQFEEASRMIKAASIEEIKRKLHFVIVGGGYTGVETAGQMADLFDGEFHELYPEIPKDIPQVTLVQGGDRILPILDTSSSQKAKMRLEKLGVNVRTGARASALNPQQLELNNGESIETENVIWASGIRAVGAQFFDEDQIEKGRVQVTSTLQMEEYPEVFVIGDLAAVSNGKGPHPQTGQAAVQQASIIGPNLHRFMKEEPLEPFLYHHKGDLVPIGDHWAIAQISGVKFSGFLAWWMRRTVYLLGLSWSKRFKVVFSWTINLFSKRDTTRL